MLLLIFNLVFFSALQGIKETAILLVSLESSVLFISTDLFYVNHWANQWVLVINHWPGLPCAVTYYSTAGAGHAHALPRSANHSTQSGCPAAVYFRRAVGKRLKKFFMVFTFTALTMTNNHSCV